VVADPIVRVEGLRELNRDLKRLEPETAKLLRTDIRAIAERVAIEARATAPSAHRHVRPQHPGVRHATRRQYRLTAPAGRGAALRRHHPSRVACRSSFPPVPSSRRRLTVTLTASSMRSATRSNRPRFAWAGTIGEPILGADPHHPGQQYDVEKDFTWEELMLVEQQSGVPLGRDDAFESMATVAAFVFVIEKRDDEKPDVGGVRQAADRRLRRRRAG
jgi:hypothetical protein